MDITSVVYQPSINKTQLGNITFISPFLLCISTILKNLILYLIQNLTELTPIFYLSISKILVNLTVTRLWLWRP